MKFRVFTIAILPGLLGSAATAAPIDALSWLRVDHGYTVGTGAAPAGIQHTVGGPTFHPSTGVATAIDDAAAVVALDNLDVTVGCASCNPPYPYEELRQHRTNRTDPTEFALAETDIERNFIQDEDAQFLAFGQSDTTRTGLAQARITSSPTAASAEAGHGISRTSTFENVSNQTISFNITGYFDVEMWALFDGADGFARASTSVEWLFSGIGADALSYVPLDTYFLDIDEADPGAAVTELLVASQPGTLGLRFSGSTTALGDGGYTEARLDAEHEFILRLTLDPGEVATMQASYLQSNAVEYVPALAPVPLPAGLPLLLGALGGFSLVARRRA